MIGSNKHLDFLLRIHFENGANLEGGEYQSRLGLVKPDSTMQAEVPALEFRQTASTNRQIPGDQIRSRATN